MARRPARLAACSTVSAALALQSDRRLGDLVDAGTPIGTGIGGSVLLVRVDGTPVFVKRVPLTDLERRPGNVMSTANLFQLPAFYQYGVNSAGFGAWRELAAHAMTTSWVLGSGCQGFPLLYHWRVLPAPAAAVPDELQDVDRAVGYWNGSAAVRERIEAIRQSSASIVLFLEYFPQNLDEWLSARLAQGGAVAERACVMVERGLRTGVGCMNSRGLLHFDAHFENILTDGRRLYFADFGLAACSRFELSPAEYGFLAEHAGYDRCSTVTHLVYSLLRGLCGYGRAGIDAVVRECAEGREPPPGLPRAAAAIITRYAPVAAVMGGFYWQLQSESRTTPYPAGQLRLLEQQLSWP
ncbi:MAG: serine/threonine protein phosphatase [Streptosporangiaceae bacterium]|jgi:serine/threonine protein kinase